MLSDSPDPAVTRCTRNCFAGIAHVNYKKRLHVTFIPRYSPLLPIYGERILLFVIPSRIEMDSVYTKQITSQLG